MPITPKTTYASHSDQAINKLNHASAAYHNVKFAKRMAARIEAVIKAENNNLTPTIDVY